MSTTRTPAICGNIPTANPGDPIAWTGNTAGCIISQDGTNTWPFNVASPFTLPYRTTVSILSTLPAATYYFNVSCCPQAEATKSVNVT